MCLSKVRVVAVVLDDELELIWAAKKRINRLRNKIRVLLVVRFFEKNLALHFDASLMSNFNSLFNSADYIRLPAISS